MAIPLQFTLTGDYQASFILDSDPTPDDGIGGLYFTIWDVPGFDDAVFGVADVSFFSSGFGGGLGIEDFYGLNTLVVTDGPQLYTGTEEAPTFLTGTFALTEYQGSGTYTLTISELTADVPEPASWAMMLGGFGAIGGAMRSRRKTSVSFG